MKQVSAEKMLQTGHSMLYVYDAGENLYALLILYLQDDMCSQAVLFCRFFLSSLLGMCARLCYFTSSFFPRLVSLGQQRRGSGASRLLTITHRPPARARPGRRTCSCRHGRESISQNYMTEKMTAKRGPVSANYLRSGCFAKLVPIAAFL
jgi:hypothetical protein